MYTFVYFKETKTDDGLVHCNYLFNSYVCDCFNVKGKGVIFLLLFLIFV